MRPDPAYGSGGASTIGTYDTPSSGERSKADEAREQGRQVADTAKGEARSVAEEAKGQAGRVAEEAKEQSRNLLSEAQSQLRVQARSQTDRAAGFAQEIASSLRALSEGRTDEAGPLADYARQATQQVQQFADRIEERGFDGLVQDVQRFARRRPGAFLLGAALAGFATGRVVHGARDAQSSSAEGGQYSGQYQYTGQQLTSTTATGGYGTSGTYTTSETYTGTAPQVGGSTYPGLSSRDEPLTDAADESAYTGSRLRPDEQRY